MKDRLFFTLPKSLLTVTVGELEREAFDSELLDLEYALSDVCRDHTQNVGFWGGQPILYRLLRWLEMPHVPPENRAVVGHEP